MTVYEVYVEGGKGRDGEDFAEVLGPDSGWKLLDR